MNPLFKLFSLTHKYMDCDFKFVNYYFKFQIKLLLELLNFDKGWFFYFNFLKDLNSFAFLKESFLYELILQMKEQKMNHNNI
jgi:hypothetical protein